MGHKGMRQGKGCGKDLHAAATSGRSTVSGRKSNGTRHEGTCSGKTQGDSAKAACMREAAPQGNGGRGRRLGLQGEAAHLALNGCGRARKGAARQGSKGGGTARRGDAGEM